MREKVKRHGTRRNCPWGRHLAPVLTKVKTNQGHGANHVLLDTHRPAVKNASNSPRRIPPLSSYPPEIIRKESKMLT